MKRKICVLCDDGVEEMELVVPVDIFRRNKLKSDIVAVKNHSAIITAHGIKFIADMILDSIDVDDYDALVLPGGPSSFDLKDNIEVVKIVKSFNSRGKLIGAICAAPLILHEAGVLADKKYCSHPCTHDVLTDADRSARVMIDGSIITAKGPGVAAEFAIEILKYLCGEKDTDAIVSEMFL